MILYEFEGKKILAKAGIPVPTSQLLDSPDDQVGLKYPIVLKAQVLSGKRKDAGGILFVNNDQEARDKVQELFGSEINKEKVEKILAEEKADIAEEYYFSLSYDTNHRAPIITYSKAGGTGIEERGAQVFPINPLKVAEDLPDILDKEFLVKLINLFFELDATLLEINPLIKTKDGQYMALDAKVNLDDTAAGRHKDEWNFPPRSVAGYKPTSHEIRAKKIDQEDYRGTAGSTYFDFEGGDIAILASGGGASITAMDALVKVGGKAANFTEYSGNPPREKVQKLTEIVLDKPNIHALWVVGALANFTDIFETLGGLIDSLKELNPKFPIVIRRAGPRDKEAFEMIRASSGDLDLHLYGEETSIPESAQIVTDLAKKYASIT